MKRRRYVIGILLCVTALLQAQDSVKSFDEFFVAGMDKIDGVFPVYVAEKEIYLEIPEHLSDKNLELYASILKELHEYGFSLAIDDFGAGYSNFERLTELRVDFIKIDGSLIKNIHQNEETKIIVKTIVNFAKELNIKTIAEYVHSNEVLMCVNEIGIDYAQGFYIGKPHPELPTNAQ